MPPFSRVGETTLHQWFRFAVKEVRYRSVDGTEFDRQVVHHPGAVAVVPLHDDGTVTLVRQFRAALDSELLELPAGLRDVEGEADADTAARELIEEAGLRAGRLEQLVAFHNSPGFSDESVSVFLGTELEAVADDRQGIEEQHMAVERLSMADALAQIGDGRITDAKTIIGLSLVARRLTG